MESKVLSHKKVALVDSGIANLNSVEKALRWVGLDVVVTNDSSELKSAAGVVFPGVGSFAQAMLHINKNGLDTVLEEVVSSGKPFLGICLGLQLFFTSSEESYEVEGADIGGLNWLAGEVKRFPPGQPIPHVGWNRAFLCQKGHPLFNGLPERPYFYFTHSYYVDPEDAAVKLSETAYGVNFASAVAKGNLMGVQFHPEKSGPEGLHLLRNFGNMI